MPSLERIKDMSEKILIVDDEVEIADLIEVYLKNENYKMCIRDSRKGSAPSRPKGIKSEGRGSPGTEGNFPPFA